MGLQRFTRSGSAVDQWLESGGTNGARDGGRLASMVGPKDVQRMISPTLGGG